MILNKVNKTIGLLRKCQNILPRHCVKSVQIRSFFWSVFSCIQCDRILYSVWSALPTIYKTFIWPHLSYDDIIYGQPYNASFHQKLELLQCNACLAITGAIRGTSKEKLYEETGLESFQLRLWYRKLFCFTNSSIVNTLVIYGYWNVAKVKKFI